MSAIRKLRLSGRKISALRNSCYQICAATQNKGGKFARVLIFVSCQRTANPCTPVRFRPPPPKINGISPLKLLRAAGKALSALPRVR